MVWFWYMFGFRTGMISVWVPAGGCTRAVAPFAGVKVCAAIWASGEIGVLHRRSPFVFTYSVNFR